LAKAFLTSIQKGGVTGQAEYCYASAEKAIKFKEAGFPYPTPSAKRLQNFLFFSEKTRYNFF